MDLQPIIEEIASQADAFLAGATSRKQGRAGIAELLNADHAHLGPADRQKVTDGVMAILEHDDFSALNLPAAPSTKTPRAMPVSKGDAAWQTPARMNRGLHRWPAFPLPAATVLSSVKDSSRTSVPS
ncbi:MAG: hypothetical protein EXS39_07635 [Opitutaceae bacterium]|nr:hypothetical protein [Opitutaceae bacterium]